MGTATVRAITYTCVSVRVNMCVNQYACFKFLHFTKNMLSALHTWWLLAHIPPPVAVFYPSENNMFLHPYPSPITP
jgi:hypothetical protein